MRASMVTASAPPRVAMSVTDIESPDAVPVTMTDGWNAIDGVEVATSASRVTGIARRIGFGSRIWDLRSG